MAVIDPSTNIGKLRLRLADWRDIQWLPDAVYQQTLDDTSNNFNRLNTHSGSIHSCYTISRYFEVSSAYWSLTTIKSLSNIVSLSLTL